MKTQFNKTTEETKNHLFISNRYIRLSILLLCSFFLFTSCFGYRTINLSEKEIKVNKKYKITTNDTKERKGKVYEVTDASIHITYDNEKSEIPISDIKEIKQKKFSVLGSTALAVVAYLGVGLIAILALLAS